MKFLFTAYHVEKFRQFYIKISTAKNAKAKLQVIEEIFEQDLKALEREWAEMLSFNYSIRVETIDDFLEKSELLIDEIMKGKYPQKFSRPEYSGQRTQRNNPEYSG